MKCYRTSRDRLTNKNPVRTQSDSDFFFFLGWVDVLIRERLKKKEKILSLINVLAFLYVCINHLLHTHQPGVHFVLLSPSKRAEGPTKTQQEAATFAGDCKQRAKYIAF